MMSSPSRRGRRLLQSVVVSLVGGFAAFHIFVACGSDEEDVNDINGQVGNVPGWFTMRIGDSYRERIDQVEAQINGLVPGLTTEFTRQFSDGDDDSTGSDGNKLSDLFKLQIPGTKVDAVNKEIFNSLVGLQDDEEVNYFELVDTRKYTNSDYAIAEADKGTEQFDQQYYLNAIGYETAVADIDALLPTSVPVVVAVFDTGMYTAHPEVSDVLWTYN